jgi:hypothetical protein
MPYHDPEPGDPHELIGVVFPGDEASTREMAYTFAEELARLGHARAEIVSIFRNPYYAGAHGAWRVLGEAAIEQIAGECASVWRAARQRRSLVERDAKRR